MPFILFLKMKNKVFMKYSFYYRIITVQLFGVLRQRVYDYPPLPPVLLFMWGLA